MFFPSFWTARSSCQPTFPNSGLQYQNFTATSAADFLQLVVSGSGGNTANLDSKTIQVVLPLAISSAASQTFVANDAWPAAANAAEVPPPEV